MRKPPPYASALALAASDPVLLSRAVRGDFHAARENADPTPNIVAPSVPALVWAGYLRREEGAYEITERGMAVLERQRIGRPRLPAPVQTEIGTGRIWAAPSLQCEEAAPHVQPQPRKLPRNLPAIARLATEHGFRLEEVPGDPGSLRVIPRRGDGYGTLDFDGHGELVCCAWELSPRREDRCRTMDLVDGVPEGELSRWLQWGRVRARDLSACSARRVDELLQAAGLRPGALGTGYIHPADPDAPAVARIEWGPGIVLGLSWLEPWGEQHNRAYPDGATETDVVAWLEPWIERQREKTRIAPPSSAETVHRVIEQLAAAGFGALAARPEEGEVTITKAPGTKSLRGLGTVTVRGELIVALSWEAGWCRATTLDPGGISPWRFETLLRRAADMRREHEAKRSKPTQAPPPEPKAVEIATPAPQPDQTGARLIDLLAPAPVPASEASEVAEVESSMWQAALDRVAARDACEAEEVPAPNALSNEPPPLIKQVRELAASCGREIEVALDATRQRKAALGVQCWKICNAAYKGGRILARLEIHPHHACLDGQMYSTDALLYIMRTRMEI